MPIAPFAPRPVPHDVEVRRARLAVAAAVVGIAAAILAYAISPSIRHAVGHAARGVGHAVARVADRVFPDHTVSAPALPTETLSGATVTLKTLHGHPALITFWSPSCAACAQSAAAVEAFARSAAPYRIVGVADGGTRPAALRFLQVHGWTFTNLRDGDGSVSRRYGAKAASALPLTIVIDSSGHIKATLRGPRTAAQLNAALTAKYNDTK